MTTYYVGPGGNNANSGLTWALRKLTLNGAEDEPVAAGDTVIVGPGTYRELLTVDVAGSAGNPITYQADYLGTLTDGVGGIVRITGTNDDIGATRAQCVNMPSARSFRTFTGFVMDTTTGVTFNVSATNSSLILDKCHISNDAANCLTISGTGTDHIIRRCFFGGRGNAINFTHTVTVDNANHLVENCIFVMGGGTNGVCIRDDRIGGLVAKNCVVMAGEIGFRVQTALTVGQTFTVNNCIIHGCNVGVQGTTATELTENFNCFWANASNRSTTSAGANSFSAPPLFDPRWFLQAVFAGAGPNNMFQVTTPFDLASYSVLVNSAGTSPPTLDMRGTAIQGAARDPGPLEYDATLKIFGNIHKSRLRIGQYG